MRAAGKKLIGAQASAAIWDGVDEWLRRNPKKSVTDFVLEASMEKLDLEKIPYDRTAALFDGRRRVPSAVKKYPEHRPDYLVIKEKTSSKADVVLEKMLGGGKKVSSRRPVSKKSAVGKHSTPISSEAP